MKLYYNPISTYSQKVLIACYEKGVEFEPHIVRLMDPEERSEYRALYPLGKIPLLVVNDEHMIPESSIIIEYLDGIAEPRLIFGDADESRKIRFADRVFDLYLNDSVVTLLFQSMKPEPDRDQELMSSKRLQIDTIYGYMEQSLAEQQFATGDRFSLADCAAAPALFYAEQIAPFEEKPNIRAYWERLKARPALQRVHEEAAPIVAEFMKDAAA